MGKTSFRVPGIIILSRHKYMFAYFFFGFYATTVQQWKYRVVVVVIVAVGCNNGVGGLHENFVTFWGTKLQGF